MPLFRKNARKASTETQNPDGHGHGQSAIGAAERAVGAVLGSEALKGRGMQKEREANTIKTQASELEEAERLEREALIHRERAVAHGAHPDNKRPGAGVTLPVEGN